ncbi:MAG: thrombospondin type 3 repeat-containing protein, partial [Ectothiorhodospiraceae bacterium]|nr:thrombospondin type 3 repeat-containing protein [Ectothiorhodospiraceae bacterium]
QATISDVAGNTATAQVTFEQAAPDTDGDGVPDASDLCPGTSAGNTVDGNGCAPSQLDTDSDGVSDAIDQCASTPAGETVNGNGCALSQLDTDSDGVSDATDQCPGTPVGEAADINGCSTSQQTGTIPPDPATIAPALDPTIATTLASATAFLYTGASPIQTGVSAGTIEVRRVAVLRGQITGRDNSPISGVTVTIHNHPEFGQTLSRTDGMFDMVVNGGGLLTINYRKAGYLSVQRQLKTPWTDYAIADTVVMIPLDSQVTTVDLTDTTQAFQVAQGSPVTDSDGTRQATMLFPQGTTATMTLPDGSTQALTTLNVRASEYTVGDNGPQTMPGELPASSAYTYAVELSVDEAIAAGATRVDFDQPIPFYVDNFLNFPVGEIVPAGWYDREKVAWIPSDNGRIIGILAITAGMADIDVDGTGIAADATQLAGLGITDAERIRLAGLYAVGKSLWRTPITHFTPWDCNWPYGPPEDATPPPPPPADDSTPDEDQNDCTGCIIQPQSQSLGEKIPVAGTPFSLHYQSKRMPGNVVSRTLEIPLSGDTVPGSLQAIELTIEIAGQVFKQSFTATPNQNFTYVWDGKDSYGRPAAQQKATIIIDYVYRLVYYGGNPDGFRTAFARATSGGAAILGQRGNRTMRSRQQWKQKLAGLAKFPFLTSNALGSWGLDIRHGYDPVSESLFQGDGSTRDAVNLSGIITTVAGNGVYGFSGDGGAAEEASFKRPRDVAVGSDGSLYIVDRGNHRVRRVTPDGIITTVAGTGVSGYSGDGGPAELAQLNGPSGITLGDDGSLYVADTSNFRVRRISRDGIISTVAGNGTGTGNSGGDGGPAIEASLSSPGDVALSRDGSIYISQLSPYYSTIRRVAPDGIISTVAGKPGFSWSCTRCEGLATKVQLASPRGVAFGLDGNLYIADTNLNIVRRLTKDGNINIMAGGNVYIEGYSGDGGLAVKAGMASPIDIAIGDDGSLYITDNSAIRLVTQNGIITTIGGLGSSVDWGLRSGYSGDGGPATQAQLNFPAGIDLGPDGSLYIADTKNNVIRKIGTSKIAGESIVKGEFLIKQTNESQVFHFDAAGRHLRTFDTTTNAVIYQFRYDIEGHLSEIEDVDG